MHPLSRLLGLGLLLPLAATAASDNPSTDQAKIDSAMSAAPTSVGARATILDFPASPGAESRLLRPGSNGWTCLPDNPATPGTDPMCLDRQWMNWMQAYMNKTRPEITGVGTAYMLQGGSDASNSDPLASRPAPGEDWLEVGPHVMIVSPARWDREVYPTSMEGDGPWIRFPDTPYEHLMMPVE